MHRPARGADCAHLRRDFTQLLLVAAADFRKGRFEDARRSGEHLLRVAAPDSQPARVARESLEKLKARGKTPPG